MKDIMGDNGLKKVTRECAAGVRMGILMMDLARRTKMRLRREVGM